MAYATNLYEVNLYDKHGTVLKQRAKGIYELHNDQEYMIEVVNNNKERRIDATVNVDGEHVGVFRVNCCKSISIDRCYFSLRKLTFNHRDLQNAEQLTTDDVYCNNIDIGSIIVTLNVEAKLSPLQIANIVTNNAKPPSISCNYAILNTAYSDSYSNFYNELVEPDQIYRGKRRSDFLLEYTDKPIVFRMRIFSKEILNTQSTADTITPIELRKEPIRGYIINCCLLNKGNGDSATPSHGEQPITNKNDTTTTTLREQSLSLLYRLINRFMKMLRL